MSPARNYLANGNPHVNDQVINAGLASAVNAGVLSPEMAATVFHPSNYRPLTPETAPALARAIRPHILVQLPQSQGGSSDVPGGAAGRLGAASAASAGTDPTVARPLAYTLAAQAYHAAGSGVAAAAREDRTLQAVGIAEQVAQAVDQVRMTKGQQAKRDVVQALLSTIANPAIREAAATHFPAFLLDHGPAR